VAKESDDSFFDMDCDAVAIMVILRRRNDRAQRRFTELTDPLQRLPDLTRFPVELMLITHVLVTTAAAPPEIGAMRGYALGRRFRHLDEFSLGEGFFFPDNARRNPLTLDCDRDEGGLA